LRHETGYPHIVKENGRKKYAGRAAGKPIPCRGKSSHAKGMPWPPVRIDNLPNSSLFRGRQSLSVFPAAITLKALNARKQRIGKVNAMTLWKNCHKVTTVNPGTK